MEDQQINDQKPSLSEGLLEKIKGLVLQNYSPVLHPTENTIYLSTREVYDKIMRIYPTDYISIQDVAEFLHEKGFTFIDRGSMNMEWIMEPWSVELLP